MKFVTYLSGNTPRLAVLDGESAVDLNGFAPGVPSDLGECLINGVDLTSIAKNALNSSANRLAVADLKYAPLVTRPGKIICLGLNYYDHAKESGRQKPDYPFFFFRGASSLLGHNQPALLPKVSTFLDYEAELAVVIGRRGKHVSASEALSLVFGYSCFNDISVRDYQKRTSQWTIGKNFDATGAFGPVLVTADELPPGASDLTIEARLNGEVMQHATTSDMIFSTAETIAMLTECMTLEPGDVLVMGTPGGVGQSRTPPVWMKEGDLCEIEIQGIGTLSNRIAAEK